MTQTKNKETSDTQNVGTEESNHLAIVTDNLTKKYGNTTGVNALNLAIECGKVYGFLGPNGAGKTTTVRMLVSLLSPTSGSGHVAGAPVTDREDLIEHIGYLPESPPLHQELTAREQLEYHGGLRDMDADELEERIEKLLDRFDLTADADNRIVTYSKGMRQKTGLIQAMMHEPDVVFLDEPTSGLDPRAARTVRETITEMASDGTTVFLSTHILPVVEEIATDVGILYDGELVAEGSPDELKERMKTDTESSLEDVFLEVTT